MFGLEKLISSLALGRVALLERRVEQLELQVAEYNLALLETIDNVSYRLSQRERKRREAASKEPTDQGTGSTADDRFLGAARRFGKS